MADENRPLLVFPAASTGVRGKLPGGGGKIATPGRQRQGERLGPTFNRLQQAMEAERGRLTAEADGIDPEKVLVFEVVGSLDDFARVIKQISGLEWLFDTGAMIEPDDDFRDVAKPEKALDGYLYLTMSDARGLTSILGLWRQYLSDIPFERGLTPWRQAFDHLHDVRWWGREDRLRETGFGDYLKETLFRDDAPVRFEVDLWHRLTGEARRAASRRVRAALEAIEGRVVGESEHPGIAYHGMLVEVPGRQVVRWVEDQETLVFDLDEIMFFRPVGQSVVAPPVPEDDPSPIEREAQSLRRAEPVVALFDGLPIENHHLLAGGLIVDDPDGLAADYPVSCRAHGTAMASLIVRGDLNAREAPLDRPIYVRPVLAPAEQTARGRVESTPPGTLIVDLMMRAVRRLFEDTTDEPAAAPSVRIINHSLGDHLRLFDGRLMSPWARALDWLAWRYRVLFVVSAGNQLAARMLDDFDDEVLMTWRRDRAVVESAFLDDAHRQRALRRLRVPAEAMNALSIGALHADASDATYLGRNFDPFETAALPSPINGLGFGYRSSIKPEILLPGGRLMFQDLPGPRPPARVTPLSIARGPGQRVAATSPRGRLDETIHGCGTSNATALATRAAARLHDVLEALRREPGGERLDDRHTAVLLKAMLVHGASWSGTESTLDRALAPAIGGAHWLDRKRAKARLLGYGAVDVDRVLACTDRRVTVLGCGELGDGEAHTYHLPIPADLSGQRGLKRVVITLAWLTPINPHHQGYRRARLWVKLANESDGKRLWHLQPIGPDHRDAQRGTVQHCVFEAERAAPIVDDQTLTLQVNGKADAGVLEEMVPYGLAVTLEVADSIPVDIYAAVRQRLRVRPAPVRAAR